MRAPIGELLKDSPRRRVIRVHAGEGRPATVVKEYRTHGLLDRLRILLGRGRARVEAANLRLARARGLPCPEPLRHDRETLVLADLGPGTGLDRALPALPRGEAIRVLERTGQLLARARDSGLDHHDLHLGNVYRSEDGGLHLLDLHAARLRDRPPALRTRDARGLYLGLPWPEQEDLRTALLSPLGLPATPPGLSRWRERHLAKRLGRCLRTSGAFVRGAEPDGMPWLQRRLLPGDPPAWRAVLAAGETRKAGRRGRVVRCSLGVGKLRDEAPSLRLWRAAEALALREIPHARAMVWCRGEGRRWWVLSEETPGRALGEILEAPGAEQRAVVADLACSLARLHATGWRCRDPRGDNLRFASGRAVFLDLDGVRPVPAWRARAARAADLGRLLAWVRYQAPAALRDRPALQRLFVVRYARTLESFGIEPGLGSLLPSVELRSRRWQRRHQQ